MKFIPPSDTVFVAKVHKSTKRSRISCQQRNVISKRRGWKTEHADRNCCKGMLREFDIDVHEGRKYSALAGSS